MTTSKTVAIIGGGISGLATAYYLRRQAPDLVCRIYESSHRVGGLIRTTQTDDWLVESSADSFLAGPDTAGALELAQNIGFADQLIETQKDNRRALVAFEGQLHPVPKGFQLLGTTNILSILDSTLLSRSGRLRLARERSIPARVDGVEESLAEFATRRLGSEAYERLVQPLVAGIYSADPNRLSVLAALPRFVEMEQEFGSLYEGLKARQQASRKAAEQSSVASGARYGLFLTPRNGMESFVDAIRAALPTEVCCLGSEITSLTPGEGRWKIQDSQGATQLTDAVVMALPTHRISPIVGFDSKLVHAFEAIRYSSVVVACIGFRRDQISHPLDAFGVVIPQVEGRQIIAISFSSVKFPRRAPDDHVLLRVFVGGACQPELVDLDDDTLRNLVRRELQAILGANGEPDHFSVNRWHKSSPQYELGHAQRVAVIESEVAHFPGLFIAGNAYHGVGIPQSITSGKKVAERIAAYLS